MIAAQSLAPRARTKNETMSSATASSGMTTPPTIPWIQKPSSPEPPAPPLSRSALSTTSPFDTRLSTPPNANAMAAACTTTPPAMIQASAE